jgi:hypothetical protein
VEFQTRAGKTNGELGRDKMPVSNLAAKPSAGSLTFASLAAGSKSNIDAAPPRLEQLFGIISFRFCITTNRLGETLKMKKSQFVLCALAVVGLLSSPLAADARSHKHHKNSSVTTGTNMKPSAKGEANPSSEGNVGPGTNNNNGPTPGGK